MRESLLQVWKYAIFTTMRRVFGHEYGCCDKWWKKCPCKHVITGGSTQEGGK